MKSYLETLEAIDERIADDRVYDGIYTDIYPLPHPPLFTLSRAFLMHLEFMNPFTLEWVEEMDRERQNLRIPSIYRKGSESSHA